MPRVTPTARPQYRLTRVIFLTSIGLDKEELIAEKKAKTQQLLAKVHTDYLRIPRCVLIP